MGVASSRADRARFNDTVGHRLTRIPHTGAGIVECEKWGPAAARRKPPLPLLGVTTRRKRSTADISNTVHRSNSLDIRRSNGWDTKRRDNPDTPNIARWSSQPVPPP